MKTISSRITQWLHIGFSVLFVISFALVVLNIIFNKGVYGYNTLILLGLTAVFLAIFVLAAIGLERKQQFFERHYRWIAVGCGVFLFLIQMLLMPMLRYDPTYDLEAIYKGAIEWVEQGTFTGYTSETSHADYFYIFPNNLGGMALLALFFKLANLIGIRDYFVVASVVNGILSVLSMLLASSICKRLFGVTGGMTALLLFLCSPPFYLIAPVFYTDALSLVFPLASFWAILQAEDSSRISRKIGWYLAAALGCLVGALIKMTVLILPIAAAGYFLLKRKWREIAVFAAAMVIVLSLGFAGFNAHMYSAHLDREKADQMNTPIEYWIACAFQGDGGYHNATFWEQRREADPVARKELLQEKIRTAVDELGLSGVYDLFERKSARAFGDGTYALSDFLDDRPEQEDGFLQQTVRYNGEHYGIYRTLSTAVFLAILILMLLSVRFKERDGKLLIPQLCVFGILLFLLFWEVNSRYITTFIPLIFICAVGGIGRVSGELRKRMLKK